MFALYSSEEIIEFILKIIKEFDMPRYGVKQNTEEAIKYKKHYNALRSYANKNNDIRVLYTCIFYAFSQQMRFNSKGEFNMPFGNGAFTELNEIYIKNGCDFFSNDKVMISNNNFTELKLDKLSVNDFIYLDPPYLNTTATYNENGGWSENDENNLYHLCEHLSMNNIKFAMSNVFENKGVINHKFIDWVHKNNYNVFTFDKFTYYACGKGNSNTKEVLITNYEM